MPNPAVQEATVSRRPLPGVIPQIEVKFTIEFTENKGKNTWALPYWRPEAQLEGVPLPIGHVSYPNIQFFDGSDKAQGEFTVRILLYPHIVHAIQAVRRGDMTGSVQAWFHYLLIQADINGTVQGVRTQTNAPSIPLNFSRDQWSELLRTVGYDGAWVVEITAPTFSAPGWEKVVEKLTEARNELGGGHPQTAAQACRDAWDAASPFLTDRWEEAKSIMQRGSTKPARYTTKADRVATVYDDLSNLLNDARFLADTAKHGADHQVSDDDALLIYRLTHSMLAYFSRQSMLAATPPAAGTRPGT